ncbi:MAG: hypothetical protein RL751_1035, partial [Bacteroidota bacterium]
MLLKICDEQLLAKIIKLNKAFWLDNADFTSNLAIACNRREIDFRLNQNLYKRVTEGYLKVVADFYFQVWKKHRKYKGYLSWLFTIYGTRKEWSYDQKQKINSELLTKVLAIDYNWIFETAFANDFTARSSNQLFIEKRIIYDLIINLIKSKDRKEFSQEFIWLINNGNDSIIDFILEDTNHFSNAAFVEQFKAKWQLYSKRSYSKFLTTYILSQHDLTISADLKWLLEHGETEHLHQIINTHQIYWQNNSAFVEQILSFKSVTNRKRVYHKRLDIDDPLVVDYQIEAFQEFIYEIWKSKGKIIFDTHLDWLFTNGNDSFLHDVFEIEKKIWINEKGIIDFMFDEKIKFWPDRMFLEAFFIELCLNPKHTHHKKAMTRLFTEGSLEAIKVLITKKLNYSTEILEKIYSAFYPSNDLAYYSKKAINSEWSPDFKEQYIRERVSLINMQFKRLFKEEMEAEASQLVKKTWSKKSTHSATDLANFAFCPASYFLNQKYELNIEEQENVFIGNTEHNKQRLLRLADRTGAKEQKTNAKFKNFYLDFSRILHAKAIAQGHGTTKPVIHYSKKGKLSGIPDYI